jgi:hypothetical protein
LAASAGWNVHFGRELNATDDKGAFVPFTGRGGGRPVLEGKNIEPFRTSVDGCRYQLRRGAASERIARMPRVAYRDIASATNRLTLIAAIIPPHVVTTHTLFCLKTRMAIDAQHVLCALMNSFVANYLVRLRVNTHVTSALVSRTAGAARREGRRGFPAEWPCSHGNWPRGMNLLNPRSPTLGCKPRSRASID